MGNVCVIGAGSSGIAACQVLQARGIPLDCFEIGSSIGGNWRYNNDNGLSSAYRSLHANSSRRGMQYATFPMPDSYPDYLSHRLVTSYLDDYVDHFGFRHRIQFRTEVTRVAPAPAPGDGWDVTVRSRRSGQTRTDRYRAVLVANGHHWDPRYPEPAFPGADSFTGVQLHSHHYRTPEQFAGQRVLVLGIGNSACDAAVDCSQVAARTLLAMRRGAHIVPKYLFGRPIDHLTLMRLGTRAPLGLQRPVVAALVRIAQGKVTNYGLPEPDHKMLCAPPTVTDSLLSKLRHGDIAVRPNIARFGADRVYFADGSSELVDVVIYCTGYKISFPFLAPELIGQAGGGISLYRRVASPGLPGLYFIGLVQPIGAIMPVAEMQSQWVADLLDGRAALPSAPEMHREIARHRAAAARRYGPAVDHAIRVDFLAYCRQIRAERRAGARRAAAAAATPRSRRIGPALPVDSGAEYSSQKQRTHRGGADHRPDLAAGVQQPGGGARGRWLDVAHGNRGHGREHPSHAGPGNQEGRQEVIPRRTWRRGQRRPAHARREQDQAGDQDVLPADAVRQPARHRRNEQDQDRGRGERQAWRSSSALDHALQGGRRPEGVRLRRRRAVPGRTPSGRSVPPRRCASGPGDKWP